MSSLINLTQVTKIYRTGTGEFLALRGVDFCLQQGEMVAIMGASGSGKSTLMNIIGFLDHCTTGKYIFANQDVSFLPEQQLAGIRNKKIGFVFQSFFLLPRLNALQNVMLPLFYRSEDKKTALNKAQEMLKKVGMEKLVDHKPNQLSGGQQQRVAIARALVTNPDVILADEPTGALDSKTGHEVMELFLKLHSEEKRSIVIITHDNEVSRLCQRTVMLKDGSVV